MSGLDDKKIDDLDHYEHDNELGTGKNAVEHVTDNYAAGYVNPDLVIDEAENKRLRWKIHKRLLPIMSLAYLTQALDKGTLGTSSIMGWQADVGAVGQDYALTSTFLWVGIIIGEPIANQFIRRLPVAKVLGYCMLVWSSLVMGLAFAKSVPPVFAIRLLLGLFESVFGPCLMAITIQWYVKEEQAAIQAIWQSMFGVATAVSSILAYGFYHLTSKPRGMAGWQWMTVTLSLISFTASGVVLRFLPDSPTTARWASEDEKVKFVERVRANDQGIKQKQWKSEQAREAFTDPFSWLLFAMMLFQTLVVGGVNTFNSLLINKGFGFDVLTSQLLGIPLAVDTVLLYFLMAYLVTKTNQTVYCMIGFVIVNVIGTVVLITVAPTAATRPGLIVAFYLMQCFQACSPPMFAMLSRNVAGQTKKSITYVFFYVGWATGNAIAPQIFQSKWAPRYLNSLYIHLGLYACFIAVVMTMRILLARRNSKKIAAQTNDNGDVVNHNTHAFEDLTDLQNPDFRYSF